MSHDITIRPAGANAAGLVFGSPEAARVARRDRLAARLVVDNGARGEEMPQDHLFDGAAVVALCGAGRAPCGAEYCRPYDPTFEASHPFDDAGICDDCLAALDGAP